MYKRSIAFVFCIITIAVPAFPATFVLTPADQIVNESFTIQIDILELVEAIGFDIEVEWDPEIIECTSFNYDSNMLPGFAEFIHSMDSSSGVLETVLLKMTPGGMTGNAIACISIHFQPVSTGTSPVFIRKSWQSDNPVLLDIDGTSIHAEVDTANVIIGVEEEPVTCVSLHQNYPNPFNPLTSIRFDIPAESPVRLRIFNVNGQLIRSLIDNMIYGEGKWTETWDGIDDKGNRVPSGVYFYTLETAGQSESKKMVILR